MKEVRLVRGGEFEGKQVVRLQRMTGSEKLRCGA